jgi:metacaspase-1
MKGSGFFVSVVLIVVQVAAQNPASRPVSHAGAPTHRGIALSIGLNSVDPVHYQGWTGTLKACEADANDMAAIAASRGFASTTLLTAKATTTAVLTAINDAAKALEDGDMFLITFSGHGGKVEDRTGDESDGYDETWCLFDAEMPDDQLAEQWAAFESGVRVLVISDSCYSGSVARVRAFREFLDLDPISIPGARALSVRAQALDSPGPSFAPAPTASYVRAMPLEVGIAVFQANRPHYEALAKKVPDERKSEQAIKASVLLISGCQDNQLSYDGEVNGAFTAALRSVWSSGGFDGTYRQFHEAILARMPLIQCPNYFIIGDCNRKFELQKPFTL